MAQYLALRSKSRVSKLSFVLFICLTLILRIQWQISIRFENFAFGFVKRLSLLADQIWFLKTRPIIFRQQIGTKHFQNPTFWFWIRATLMKLISGNSKTPLI